MPIIDIQKRARELGRIRIGHTQPTKSGKTRPAKLDRFRITSQSRPLVERVAALYGGTVEEWTPANGGPSGWEVITDSARLPVLVPPQPVSQYYELWSGGGCMRRCDGQREILSESPCLCDPDPEDRECAPTTRLNVVLREVEGIGVFRLESHGYYAAAELPAVAEMLAQTSGYVSAWLALEERTAKRGGQTRRWMVPTLEVDITPAQLMSGQGGVSPAVATGQEPEVASGQGAPALESGAEGTLRPWLDRLGQASTSGEVRELYREAVAAGVMSQTLSTAMREVAASLPDGQAEEVAEEVATVEAEAEAPAEPVGAYTDAGNHEDARARAEAAWMQIITTAGDGWTTSELNDAFAVRYAGTLPGSADAGQLREFLADLQAGRVSHAGTASEGGLPF
jgi:hypothetical protein